MNILRSKSCQKPNDGTQMQGLSFLIGTAICGGMFIVLYSRFVNEWSKKDRNLTLIAGQIIFLLALAGLGLAGNLLWGRPRSL